MSAPIPPTSLSQEREARKPRSSTSASLSDDSTFAYQDAPETSNPDPDDTCKRYIEALGPLVSDAELEMTKKAVEAFRDGVGKEYQEKLKEYAKTRPSYIEEFWDDTYLVHNESVVLNLNPFFALEDDPTPSRANQVARATSLVLSLT